MEAYERLTGNLAFQTVNRYRIDPNKPSKDEPATEQKPLRASNSSALRYRSVTDNDILQSIQKEDREEASMTSVLKGVSESRSAVD